MRVRAGVALGLAALVAAAAPAAWAGGGAGPADPAPPGGYDLQWVTVAHAGGEPRTWRRDGETARERRGFAFVRDIVGRDRPPPPGQPSACPDGVSVTLVYEDETLAYGPCRLPVTIRRAVRAVERVESLATCERASRNVETTNGAAIALGPSRILGLGDGARARVRTRPNGRVTLAATGPLAPEPRLLLHAWSCAGDVGGYLYLYPRWGPLDDAELPPGLASDDVRMLTGRLRTSGLLRLYLDDTDGRFHGTAVLRVIRPGRP